MASIDRRDPRALTLLARILYANDQSPATYQEIQQLLQTLGTPDLIIYTPDVQRVTGINTTYTTPLIASILRGSPNLITFLLNEGADINFGGSSVIGTPLDYAIYRDNLPLAEVFRQHGAVAKHPIGRDRAELNRRDRFFSLRPGEGPGFYQAKTSFVGRTR
jgi:hypothetical protein